MNQTSAYLEKVHIRNYMSLHNIEVPLEPFTVLVGPNGSGKTNILEALVSISAMMTKGEPDIDICEMWAGEYGSITFQLDTKINNNKTTYIVEIKPGEENQISQEKLTVNKADIIFIEDGKGKVTDEDGTKETDYRSKKLAMKSAGDYGNKPITNALNKFICKWEFYNFDRESILSRDHELDAVINSPDDSLPKELDYSGSWLRYVLLNWHKNMPGRFEAVNNTFQRHSKFRMDVRKNDNELIFFEGYSNPITIHLLSDGTLRLLAYLVLLNQPDLPPLLTIEEPERNVHPAWLSIISDILLQLSERTQVIITTHSSQLLDTFTPQNLNENVGILLLHNIPGSGTEVIPLDKIRNDRKGLQKWIDEFGIGSAIFDSEILQDIMQDHREI
ncbi:MAG: AAA family ATPase [Desulfobacterales bacterium]|nr:AAA family ATPase [Desulfobacterales bacterium]